MNKGDILWGRKNSDAFHPIVYLRNRDRNFFVGAMLTSKLCKDNVLMDTKHFKTADSNGKKFEFLYNNTHVVPNELIKKDEWKPFRKVGELTDEGIKFVESKINHTSPVTWEDYSKLS